MKTNVKSLYCLNNSTNEVIKKIKLNTNFSDFDEKSGGIFTGELIVIGARPNMGIEETISLMFSNIAQTKKVLFTSLYKTSNDFKILFKNHNVDSNTEKNMFFYKIKQNNFEDVQVTIINLIKENNVDFIVIEGFEYLIDHNKKGLNNEISFSLRQTAIDLNVCILLKVPINRKTEKRGGERKANVFDILSFNGLENIADKILFTHRADYYGFTCDDDGVSVINQIELIIAKNNLKETGSVIYQL